MTLQGKTRYKLIKHKPFYYYYSGLLYLSIIDYKLCTSACICDVFLFLLGTVGLFALMDRLVMAGFQRRSGPYSIGWFGLLQPIVDGIKLIKKESIIVQK